jgi:DUF4097 and DUF4098 domain-containing protein YvlB
MTLTSLALLASLATTTVAGAGGAAQPQGNRNADRRAIDETIPVPKGARIDYDSCMGDVVVRTWNKDAVRVQTTRATRPALQVRLRDQVLVIDNPRGPAATIDVELTVPAWIGLKLAGVSCFVDADGVDGPMEIATVEGDILLRNVGGTIKAHTVDGAMTVENSRGGLNLNTVDQDIIVRNCSGTIEVQSVDGDVFLTGVRSALVDATTVDGDIKFSGAWVPNGRYSLTTHDGDVWLAVPDNPSATLEVRLFNNPDVDSTVTLPKPGPSRARRRTYTFGAGAAQIEIETFDGALRLRRISEMPK